jgi:hypothetical protein
VSKLYCEFKLEEKSPKIKKIVDPDIKRSISWGYFDGAREGHPICFGAEVVLFISINHFFNIRYAQGHGSNAKVELLKLYGKYSLWLIL